MTQSDLSLLVLLFVLSFAETTSQQHDAEGILFPIGRSDLVLQNDDDVSSEQITIPRFPFFGQSFTTLYVNTNGLISFGEGVTSYDSDPFPLDSGQPVIAVFWADADTSDYGTVMHRHLLRPSAMDAMFCRADDIVRRFYGAVAPEFTASWMLIATWYRAPFYGYDDGSITNTFQAVMVTNGAQSFVIFNYEDISWTTGSSDDGNSSGLGGDQAKVGFDAFDGVNYYAVPGSSTADIVNIDEGSNIGTTGRWLFRIDTAGIRAPSDLYGPVVTCPNDVTSVDVDPGTAYATVTWSSSPTASDDFEGPINPDGIVCFDNVGNVVTSGTGFPVGTSTVSCRATDSVPNEGWCYFHITVRDTEGPVVTCPISVPALNVGVGVGYAFVTWPLIPSANDVVEGYVDAASIACEDHLGAAVTSGDRYPIGYTVVTCRVTDSTLNEGSCQFTISVVGPPDFTSPDVICPVVSASYFAEAGSASAVVVWSAMPSAYDLYDGLPINPATIACADRSGVIVSSGDRFSVGSTTVTCRAQDTALNEGSCQMTILVVDNEAPSVTCPSDLPAVNVAPGLAHTRVFWPSLPSASDVVDGFIDTNDIVCQDSSGNVVTSGSSYPAGSTTVTCLARDTAQNVGSCHFNVIVVDNIAPVVTCAANVNGVNVGDRRPDAAVVWSQSPTANDNVDGVIEPVVCQDVAGIAVTSGGRYPIGTTIVTCRAVDASLNEGFCQFYITVLDTKGPVVTCPESVSANVGENGRYDVAVVWLAMPSAVDAVDGSISSITCRDDNGGAVVMSGDRFVVGTTIVTCLASDSNQNEGSCHFSITVLADTEAPVITCPANVPFQAVSRGEVNTEWVWSETPSAVDAVEGEMDPASITCREVSGAGVVSGGQYGVGVTTVTCTAVDSSDNEGSCQFYIRVVDNSDREGPVLTCPANVPLKTVDTGRDDAVVEWSSLPSAFDSVDGSINSALIACTNDYGLTVFSGSRVEVGTTIVTCQTYDSAGNTGYCHFSINVQGAVGDYWPTAVGIALAVAVISLAFVLVLMCFLLARKYTGKRVTKKPDNNNHAGESRALRNPYSIRPSIERDFMRPYVVSGMSE